MKWLYPAAVIRAKINGHTPNCKQCCFFIKKADPNIWCHKQSRDPNMGRNWDHPQQNCEHFNDQVEEPSGSDAPAHNA